jgi:hypothetical protein
MRFQRTAFGALAFAAILAGSAAFYLRDPPVPPDSVELMPAYHDPALLSRAWSLPVAHLYGPQGYMFQQNPSTCGPTSIADVLHSEGRQADPDSVMEGSGVFQIFGILPGGLTLDQEAEILERKAASLSKSFAISRSTISAPKWQRAMTPVIASSSISRACRSSAADTAISPRSLAICRLKTSCLSAMSTHTISRR